MCVSLSSLRNRVDMVPREKQMEHRTICLTMAEVHWKQVSQLTRML